MSLRRAALLCIAAWVHCSSGEGLIPNVLPPDYFHRFVTRPDILAPAWNIVVHDRERISPGYWFTGLYYTPTHDADQQHYIGPFIYDNAGALVWSAAGRFSHADATDFKVSRMQGRDVLSFIDMHNGLATFLDDRYDVIKQHDMNQWGGDTNLHELNVVADGARVYHFTKYDAEATPEMMQAAGLGYDATCRIRSHTMVGVDTSDPDNWTEFLDWPALEHVPLEDSTKRENITEFCEVGWDTYHFNSIDECPDGNIVLSVRHADAIYKVNREDGSIIWRFGGTKSDFQSDFVFSRQHHARCHEANETHTILTFMDNAWGDGEATFTHPYSRGLKVAMDMTANTAHILQEYPHPRRDHAGTRGTVQLLPNGNVMTDWATQSLRAEYTADGELLMEAHILPLWLATYRSYKFDWVGRPNEHPAVHAEAVQSGDASVTIVHVSWNGATEVASWNLYTTDPRPDVPRDNNDDDVPRRKIASSPRTGFETLLSCDGYFEHLFIEALDLHGTSLVLVGPVNVPAARSAEAFAAEDGAAFAAWLGVVPSPKEPHPSHLRAVVLTFVGGNACMAAILLALWWLGCIDRRLSWRAPWSAYRLLHGGAKTGPVALHSLTREEEEAVYEQDDLEDLQERDACLGAEE